MPRASQRTGMYGVMVRSVTRVAGRWAVQLSQGSGRARWLAAVVAAGWPNWTTPDGPRRWVQALRDVDGEALRAVTARLSTALEQRASGPEGGNP